MNAVTKTNSQTRLNREHNGMTFVFREDGYLNMSKACSMYGKDLQAFMRKYDTIEYIEELSKVVATTELEIIQAQAGRYGGTWAHPKLATFFARWLDVKFAVFCDTVIDDILRGHSVVHVINPAKAAAPQLPQTYLESLQELIESVKEQERLKAEVQAVKVVVQKQEAKLIEQAPKVEYVNKYIEDAGSLGIRAASKVLQCNERELGHWLVDQKLAYRAQPSRVLTPYATAENRGLLKLVTGMKSGSEGVFTQLRITSKGMTFLRETLPAYVYKTYN